MFKKLFVRIALGFIVAVLFACLVSYTTYRVLKKENVLITELPSLAGNYKPAESKVSASQMKDELERCSGEVQKLLEIANSVKKQKVMAESYSKVLIMLSSIEESMLNNSKVELETEMSKLASIAAFDEKIAESIKKIEGMQAIFGRKHFEETFGRVARHINAKYYYETNDGKLLGKVKYGFFRSFAYLSPSDGQISGALYEARLQLQAGNMAGVYSTIKSLKIETEKSEIFLKRLEDYNKVMNVIKDTRNYIQQITV